MISIRYPGMPQGVDAGSIIDAFNSSHDRAEQQRNETQAKSVLERYANSLYGGGGQPQTLSSLEGMFQPAAPAGSVQRASLGPVADYPSQRVAQAFGDPGAPAVAGQAGNLNSNSIAGRFLKTVRDGGVTNPYALAAIAATGKAESGFDPKNATRVWSDPSQSGEAGTAGGIMSWRNERLRNLQAFAQQNGDDPNAPSPETQARFLLSEDPSLIQKLQQAKSPQEAQQLMNNAWRFAGYDQAGGEAGRRLESANAYAQEFGGSPSQQALEGLAVGQSMPAGQGVQVADASGAVPAMPQGDASSLLPPREVMAAMFANPVTRPLAAQLAQSVIKMRAGQADPQTQLEYAIAAQKLKQLQQGEIPSGYRRSANGGLEAIPGGPADPDNPLNVKKVTPANGITIGPDGTVQIGGSQKLTEGQSKDVGYYTRGLDADAQLATFDTQLTDWSQQNADKIPLGLGNYLRDPKFRQAKQAADTFLTAVLRKDTGAAITKQEFDIYGPMFLPAPGDDQETIIQKRRARQVALLAIRSGLGTAEAVAKANEVTLGLPAANPNNANGAKTIQTQDEYDALPSGATYIDPDDGKTYRKP